MSIYAAWKTAIQSASGTYLSIWNVDDKRTENSLKLQSEMLQQSEFSSVCGPFLIVKEFKSFSGKLIDQKDSQPHDYLKSMRHGPFLCF